MTDQHVAEADADDPTVIQAYPTKDFFISMLIKDIELTRAVADLADNCVDGAKKLRGDGRFDGLNVQLEVTPETFRIQDNCGGIDPVTARKYAFRFGRPAESPRVDSSVGQFGVGMKRAFFKLGGNIDVVSRSPHARFRMHVSVEEWKQMGPWQFKFDELEDAETPLEQCGTTITVTDLHPAVAEEFGLEAFLNQLRDDLTAAEQSSINRGLHISVNGIGLAAPSIELLQSDVLKPAHRELNFNGVGSPVLVGLSAGVAATSAPRDAGWYVFCNGRLVLRGDKSLVTGWGEGGSRVVPLFHNRYARFRGYCYFDCVDAGRLPWNTTKTGVDNDSPLYRSVRVEMVSMMSPIVDFLLELANETAEGEDAPLERAISAAVSVPVLGLAPGVFAAPLRRAAPPSNTGRIQYSKPWDEIDRARASLNVTTLREVGERTFEYYYQLECEP